MIRSRPGFSPVVTNDVPRAKPTAPARVNPDMQPAIAKHTSATAHSPLRDNAVPISAERMQALADAALKRMETAKLAKSNGTEVLVNPAPSPPPIMTTPYKD